MGQKVKFSTGSYGVEIWQGWSKYVKHTFSHSMSLRGHYEVTSGLIKDAPMELKFVNDPYDNLNIQKIFYRLTKVIMGSQWSNSKQLQMVKVTVSTWTCSPWTNKMISDALSMWPLVNGSNCADTKSLVLFWKKIPAIILMCSHGTWLG